MFPFANISKPTKLAPAGSALCTNHCHENIPQSGSNTLYEESPFSCTYFQCASCLAILYSSLYTTFTWGMDWDFLLIENGAERASSSLAEACRDIGIHTICAYICFSCLYCDAPCEKNKQRSCVVHCWVDCRCNKVSLVIPFP
ncbi:hypothetical protein DM02DRAFT_210143 [Periconia macrospinosa]|uniref:Uncharacterized protein n=1 Tax=Periconia macrospinosa TaxID=97972 RepID=A0A2V1D9M2_9PLEO|nr:hypothetical protein DM02DRAFT_210143 [Periconia macrospinosa]